jgi:hypothetical protein
MWTDLGCAFSSFCISCGPTDSRGLHRDPQRADVYTGQCFANGEVNLVGDEAILAWRVQSGSWDGVRLDRLTLAAALHANATLGDPYANPYPARAVLLVDDQAVRTSGWLWSPLRAKWEVNF